MDLGNVQWFLIKHCLSYCVSTVGLDEATVRQYIKAQEAHEQQLDQHALPKK